MSCFFPTFSAVGSETVTYSYDARGRLVQVTRSGTVNNGVQANYSYDKADNRTNVTVVTGGGGVTLTVNPTSLPNGTVGTAYSQTVSASGGSGGYSYSKTAGTLPAGLTLNGSTGALSGTPTTAATYSFTITATDSASNTGSRAYSVTTNSAPVTLTLSPTSLPNGTVGTAYSQTISASGGSGGYSYSKTAGTLPAGLTLNGSTGVLSGTPTTAATYSFTITATDSASNTGSRAYSVTTNSAPVTLTVNPTSLPNGTVGTAYSQTISASGGSGGYTYSKTAGTLPAGLALNGSTGALSGTPTTAATYSFTITATDSASNTGSRAYSVTTSGAANQPPVCTVLTIGPIPGNVTTTVTVTAAMVLNKCTDADGGTLSVTSPTMPYTINVAPYTSYTRYHTVSDGQGGTTTMTINVTRN